MTEKLNFKRIWNSPTLMTWLSYSTKALTLFGVLPLVLKQFTPSDIVLWYLFSTLISLQALADFGFRQTFSRIISYAYGGASDIGIFNKAEDNAGHSVSQIPNHSMLTNIVSTMEFIYIRLTYIVLFLMVVFGTWSMYKPIRETHDIKGAWFSWVIVIFVSCFGFYGKIYLNFLEGINKIALVRRVETLTSIGSILTSVIVLIISPSLLNLVIANQLWIIVATVRDWYLCRVVEDSLYIKVAKTIPFNKDVFRKIWQPAWRSGISGLMSVGLTNLTGLVYAQTGNTTSVASYLLAMRIINQIKEISMAPFYSKLPLLAMLRVKKQMHQFIEVVSRGMLISHLVFVLGAIFIGIFSNRMLIALGSEVHFVDYKLWICLSFAFFVHRFGAMHIQVYLSTNHIISHIADGISGLLYLITTIILIKYWGIYAVPFGMIVGYLGFYAWYAAKYSYSSMNLTFWNFEKRVILWPFVLFALYTIYVFF